MPSIKPLMAKFQQQQHGLITNEIDDGQGTCTGTQNMRGFWYDILPVQVKLFLISAQGLLRLSSHEQPTYRSTTMPHLLALQVPIMLHVLMLARDSWALTIDMVVSICCNTIVLVFS